MPDFTFDKLLFFLFAVMPGVIACWVYGLFVPNQKKDTAAMLVEVVAFSLMNLILWGWAVAALVEQYTFRTHPFVFSIASAGIVVVSPAILAVCFYVLRTRLLYRWIDHPARSSWDYFFRRRKGCWVLATFKDGKLLGGFCGAKSVASTYPTEPDLYVEEVWTIDESGAFIEKKPGTCGTIIKFSECSRIEFFELELRQASVSLVPHAESHADEIPNSVA